MCYVNINMGHMNQLHPEFKPLAQELLEVIEEFCEDAGCTFYVASSWRSPGRQMELFKRGRTLIGIDWVRISGQRTVTNARPDQTPHCITLDNEPASCAIDIALTEVGGRTWLPDNDQRWALIPAAASLVSPNLVSGGFFRSIRDFPHVELINWKELRE